MAFQHDHTSGFTLVLMHCSSLHIGTIPPLQVQLSELVGLKGSVGQRRVVMGIIGTTEAGSFTLEDTGGTVPLDLSQATVAAGFVTGGGRGKS